MTLLNNKSLALIMSLVMIAVLSAPSNHRALAADESDGGVTIPVVIPVVSPTPEPQPTTPPASEPDTMSTPGNSGNSNGNANGHGNRNNNGNSNNNGGTTTVTPVVTPTPAPEPIPTPTASTTPTTQPAPTQSTGGIASTTPPAANTSTSTPVTGTNTSSTTPATGGGTSNTDTNKDEQKPVTPVVVPVSQPQQSNPITSFFAPLNYSTVIGSPLANILRPNRATTTVSVTASTTVSAATTTAATTTVVASQGTTTPVSGTTKPEIPSTGARLASAIPGQVASVIGIAPLQKVMDYFAPDDYYIVNDNLTKGTSMTLVSIAALFGILGSALLLSHRMEAYRRTPRTYPISA